MKAAVCQMEIEFENKENNLKRAEKFIAAAAMENADIIFFPEMSFTGFSMNIEKTREMDEYSKKRICQAATKHKIAIGFGVTVLRNGKGENHYILSDKNGKVISDYIKLHSFSIGGEREQFRKGNNIVTAHICGRYISTFICYDLRFPEIFRAAAGVSSIIAVAANWPSARSMHWTALLRARAIENQVYVIGINCTGRQENIEYSGDSCVISPSGEIMYQAKSGSEELFFCDIPDNVEEIRKEFPVLNDRRADFYRKLI